MAFVQDFSISQTALNPALIIAEDTSTGVDAAITQRRIFFLDSEGNYLAESGVTTDYNAWAYATNPKSFDVLTEDTALQITVQWLDVSNNVLYSKTQSYCLAYYNKQFLYYLVQQQSLNPGIVQDTSYNSNVALFWTTIIGAVNAVTIGDDISASQNSLNRGTEMRNNQSFYF